MKIELSIHATNLKNVAGMLKGISDPYCTVTRIGDDQSTLLGTSEVVKNNLSPDWARVFVLDDYSPNDGGVVKIAVSIFDKVASGNDISMGSAIFEVGAVLAARGAYVRVGWCLLIKTKLRQQTGMNQPRKEASD
jgi:Ca2+-dependent lipid-binding protein